jgi:hypothetical protein
MNYTNLVLFGLGLFGVLIHNLIKVDSINRQSEGHFDFKKFISIEWPSIGISLSVVCVCLIAKHEIKQLEEVGNWLGLAFVTIGYTAQSIVYRYLGTAEKKIKGDA